MEINAGRNSAIDVIVQKIINKEENGKKKRPSFSTIFDKLNSKKIDTKKPLNNLLTQEQMFRYYINDTEPLLKVSNDGFLQNLDLFGGSDIKAQYDMIEGQISLGGNIRGKRTLPEGFNDPEIVPKKQDGINDPEIVPKIENDIDDTDQEEEDEIEPKMEDEEDEEEEAGMQQFKLFDFPAYEAGTNFLRIEPKKDEFEDALERNEFMQIYGEQPKLENLLQASGNYLSQIQPMQIDPFLTIPAKKQQIEPKIQEEAGMDIPQEEDDDIISDILQSPTEITEKDEFMMLEPAQPKGQLRKFDDEWINFKKRVNEFRQKNGIQKRYRPNIEKWLNE